MKTKILVEIAVMSLLVFLLDLLSHLIPIPGTHDGISLYMLPIFLMSFKHGVKVGIYTGLSSSVLFFLFGHYHTFVWVQFMLDYILALSVIAVSGIYSKKIRSCDCDCEERNSYIIKGVFIGSLLKLVFNSISVLLFIEMYLDTEHNPNLFHHLLETDQIIFSIIYSSIIVVPAAILTTIVLVKSFSKYGNKLLGL
ncbi:energy-coupled thiamine transporter ThiT [Mycoplasmatota bacterium zrk1]